MVWPTNIKMVERQLQRQITELEAQYDNQTTKQSMLLLQEVLFAKIAENDKLMEKLRMMEAARNDAEIQHVVQIERLQREAEMRQQQINVLKLRNDSLSVELAKIEDHNALLLDFIAQCTAAMRRAREALEDLRF